MTDQDRLVARTAARQHGAFSTTQIPTLTRSSIRTRREHGRWRAVHRAVYVVEGAPDTWEQRVWIALLVSGAGSVVGTRAAGAIHGIRGLPRGPIDIIQPEDTVPHVKSPTSRRSLRLPPWHVTEEDGFPVTTIERTLFDLAGLTSQRRRRRGWAYLPEARVARLVDNAIVQGLVRIPDLARVHSSLAGRGRPGSRLMRELIEARSDRYVPTDSELEDAFLKLIADHGLPAPQRQVSLGSADALIGRVDFFYDEARLVVEADSVAYHLQRDQMLADHRRDLDLLAAGWQVLRVDWWQLTNEGAKFARLLRRVLERRAAA